MFKNNAITRLQAAFCTALYPMGNNEAKVSPSDQALSDLFCYLGALEGMAAIPGLLWYVAPCDAEQITGE